MAVTAVQSNSMPQGGPAAQQPVPANLTPADIANLVEMLEPVITQFRKQSTPMRVPLADMTPGLGQEANIRVANVGLGSRFVTHHHAVFQFANTSGGAAVVPLGSFFPHCLVAQTRIEINGGATVYSVDGTMSNFPALRDRKGGLVAPLSPALVRLAFGGALTQLATSSSNMCGFSQVSVANAAAGVNAQLTADWYTFEKVAYNRDTLLGALPLQNNSTYATLTRRLQGVLTGDASAPFNWTPAANESVSLVSYTANTSYEFWSVPSDPALYEPMVSNSYQTLQQTNIPQPTTGSGAFVFNLPQNNYLIAAHVLLRDSGGSYVGGGGQAISRLSLQYNAGSVIPITHYTDRLRAAQYIDYAEDLGFYPGYYLLDGDNTSDSQTQTDDAGWINAYEAASPQIVGDVISGFSAPGSYSVVRESLVAGAVQTIGG